MLHIMPITGTSNFRILNSDNIELGIAYYIKEKQVWEVFTNDADMTYLGTYDNLVTMLNNLVPATINHGYTNHGIGAMTQSAAVFDNAWWIIPTFFVVIILCVILGSLGLL